MPHFSGGTLILKDQVGYFLYVLICYIALDHVSASTHPELDGLSCPSLPL